MTKKILNRAKSIDHDIKVLEDIKYEQDKNHWVGFRVPTNSPLDSFQTRELQDAFKQFVTIQLEIAKDMLNEL